MKRIVTILIMVLMVTTMLLSGATANEMYEFEDFNPSTLYVSFQFTPRDEPSMSAKRIGSLPKLNTKFDGCAVAEGSNEWVEITQGDQTLYTRKAFLSTDMYKIKLPESCILYNEYNVDARNFASIASSEVGGKTAYITAQWGDIARVVIPNCGEGDRNWAGYINVEENIPLYGSFPFFSDNDFEEAITITKTPVYMWPAISSNEVVETLPCGTEVEISQPQDGWVIISKKDDGTNLGYTLAGYLAKNYSWKDLGNRYLYLLTEPGRDALSSYGTAITWQFKETVLYFAETEESPTKVVFPISSQNGNVLEDGRMGFPVWAD